MSHHRPIEGCSDELRKVHPVAADVADGTVWNCPECGRAFEKITGANGPAWVWRRLPNNRFRARPDVTTEARAGRDYDAPELDPAAPPETH
jgi:hypothetical protein